MRLLHSGLWVGHYTQDRTKYEQQMTLEFADGIMRGDGIDELGEFTIDGEYRFEEDVRMGWIKTYQNAHSVLYLGKLSTDQIKGQWNISGMKGEFALHPHLRSSKGNLL